MVKIDEIFRFTYKAKRIASSKDERSRLALLFYSQLLTDDQILKLADLIQLNSSNLIELPKALQK